MNIFDFLDTEDGRKMRAVYDKMTDGPRIRLLHLVEECCELVVTLIHEIRKSQRKQYPEKTLEEIVDVILLLDANWDWFEYVKADTVFEGRVNAMSDCPQSNLRDLLIKKLTDFIPLIEECSRLAEDTLSMRYLAEELVAYLAAYVQHYEGFDAMYEKKSLERRAYIRGEIFK